MKGDKSRFVNTHFWDDNYITTLDPSEKLLFLYLLTNPLTNWIGIYEISLRRIGFDTGFDKDTLQRMLDRFSESEKVFYYNGYILLVNFIKNQSFNANMEKGNLAKASYLPAEIKAFILSKNIKGFETLRNHFEPFETLPKGSLNRKERKGKEIEREIESKKETIPNNSDFLDLSIHIDPNEFNEEEKTARINSIHNELKNSEKWLTDLRRITKANHADTWHMVKQFLDEIKAKDDFYKPLRDIKAHCVSWIRKYKPATVS